MGSKLILSNSQSRATLAVLDTCLIVGLRPLITILITASLSAKCTAETLLDKNVCGWVRAPSTQLVNLLFSCDMLGLGFGKKNCPSFLMASMFGLCFVFG